MTTLPADDDSGSDLQPAFGAAGAVNAAVADLIMILDAVSVPIIVIRCDFVVACFNRAAASILGLGPFDIGRSPHAISVLSGLPKLDSWCAEVISTEVPTQHDIRIGDKSFIVRIAPYSEGQLSGTVLTYTNVTAFRASLDQAISEREYAKAILNTVADPLVVLGADLRVLTANRAFYSLFRVSREEIQGASLKTLASGVLDLPRLTAQLREMLTDDIAFQAFEIDCDWPALGRRTMSLYACPFAAPAQPVRMALLSLHDVTGLRQAEESNSRLAAIVEWSDDAIVTEDIDGIITSWNGGAQRMFGYAPDEIIGKPITLLIPENRLNDERNSLARVKRGERIEPYDTVRQRKDGSLTEISVTISPLRDAAGITIGASRIARDITDRKQAEETLRLLAHEVDHRSKNLLSLVQATVHFSKADTAEEIKMAIEGRIHALSNVHNLLAQSRWTGADLRHLVTDELRPYCSEGASATEIVGPDISLKPQIAQLIAMVLHELTTNAVKYGALSVSQGRVCIEWSLATSGRLALRWIETGGPPVRQPQRHGFGTRVLDRAIRAQLKGDIRFDWRTEGLACEIELPVE